MKRFCDLDVVDARGASSFSCGMGVSLYGMITRVMRDPERS